MARQGRPPVIQNPFASSADPSPSASHSDLSKAYSNSVPSPLRTNFRPGDGPHDQRLGSSGSEVSRSTRRGPNPANPNNNNSSMLQNPFSGGSEETSPAGSIVDLELDQINSRNKHHRTQSSLHGNVPVHPVQTMSGSYSPFADTLSMSRRGSGVEKRQKHEFKSYLLDGGKYEQSWIDDKRLKRTKRSNWMIWFCVVIGLGLCALIDVFAYLKIPKAQDYCLILDDSFSSLNPDVWNREVQINGFGTGAFDWTTTDDKNAFVDGEGLHIMPTLTTETTPITKEELFDNYVLNLTATADGDGTCTTPPEDPQWLAACSIRSNATSKATLPPVRSARLNTKGKKSIKYGRVEITAKLPKGDWLWPAMWMMPEESVYGAWPASGEIDIMEGKGNDRAYKGGGVHNIWSTLHWGPSPRQDAFWRTSSGHTMKLTDFSKGYHKFGLEWSEEYMFTYIDNPLKQVLYVDFRKRKNMWEFGQFEGRSENNTLLSNPWKQSTGSNAPFDQKFFLILNVAVGSRNGWFVDGVGHKPWVDGTESAVGDFYNAITKWLPTWGAGKDRGLTIKNVKMWQEGKC